MTPNGNYIAVVICSSLSLWGKVFADPAIPHAPAGLAPMEQKIDVQTELPPTCPPLPVVCGGG